MNLYRGADAEHRLFELQGQVFPQVGAALRPGTAARAGAEQVTEAEEVAEDVAEILEDGGIEAAHAAGTAGGAHARVSEAVVHGSLAGIGEHAISFRGFLELLLGVSVAGIAVGMELQRHLAIGALDFLLAGGADYAQHLVIITFTVAGQNSFASSAGVTSWDCAPRAPWRGAAGGLSI